MHPTSTDAARERDEASAVDRDAALRAERALAARRWVRDEGAGFLDIEVLVCEMDGTYRAQVDATLVNPRVRSLRARCLLPEEGLFSVYHVGERTKLRLRPTTSCARVYELELFGPVLTLERRGKRTSLVDREGGAPS